MAGTDGRLLAATARGALVVLKFPILSERAAASLAFGKGRKGGVREMPLEHAIFNVSPGGGEVRIAKAAVGREVGMWRRVYGASSAHAVCLLGEKWAVAAPYVPPVTDEQRHDPAVVAAVRAAIGRWVGAGAVHDDLTWRHVGVAANGAAVLFDLGACSTFDSTDEAKRSAGEEKMLSALELLV